MCGGGGSVGEVPSKVMGGRAVTGGGVAGRRGTCSVCLWHEH